MVGTTAAPSTCDGPHETKDPKCADLEFDEEGDNLWAADSTTCSSRTSSQQVVLGAMVDALLEDGSGKDSLSTPDDSDGDSAEVQRWADFEIDTDGNAFVDSPSTDPPAPHSAWPQAPIEEFAEQTWAQDQQKWSQDEQSWSPDETWSPDPNWSPDQNWPPEMCGFHWVPLAVVQMPWAPDDAQGFSYEQPCVSDEFQQVLDAQQPLKAPRTYDAAAWKKAEEKKREERRSKRDRTKKRTAAAERSAKTSSQQNGASQIKGAVEREPTTIMIRKIPRGCTRAMLQTTLDAEGFAGQYDFLYLPYSFDDWSILGHAFVNFLEHGDAEKAVNNLNGQTFWQDVGDEACEVCWSKALQGLAPCIGRFRNSPVMHESIDDQYKPMLFANGRRIDFPEANRPIQKVGRSVQSPAPVQ